MNKHHKATDTNSNWQNFKPNDYHLPWFSVIRHKKTMWQEHEMSHNCSEVGNICGFVVCLFVSDSLVLLLFRLVWDGVSGVQFWLAWYSLWTYRDSVTSVFKSWFDKCELLGFVLFYVALTGLFGGIPCSVWIQGGEGLGPVSKWCTRLCWQCCNCFCVMIWVWAAGKQAVSTYKMVPNVGLTHMASQTPWVQVLVCLLEVRMKIVESMLAAQKQAAKSSLLGMHR